MNVFEGHIGKGEKGFQKAEDKAHCAGYEVFHTATPTQQVTFHRHSDKGDTWQESIDLLIEVVRRTN